MAKVDDSKLIKLYKNRHTDQEMAEFFGVSKSWIIQKRYMLGLVKKRKQVKL